LRQSCWLFFFHSQGIIHKEFVPPRITVNTEFYKNILERLCNRIASVRPAYLWKDRSFFLLHDNAPAHTAAIVTQFLAKKCFQYSTTPVFTRFESSGLFPISKVEDGAQGAPFCHHWNHSRRGDQKVQEHS